MHTARLAARSVLVALLGLVLCAKAVSQEPQIEFQEWLVALIEEARERGINEEIIQASLSSVTPIPQVVTNELANLSKLSRNTSISV